MNHYHIYEAIGQGKYSTVYKGRKKKTIEYFALKSVDKSHKSKVLQEICSKMMTTQNTSSTIVVVSNDDLLTEILLRLPAKSILRFKSVSKHWQSLLSDRSFTLLFDKLSISPGFFFENSYFPFDGDVNRSGQPFRSLDFCHDPRGIKIVQSCNGLLLCCSANGSKVNRRYYVFNPTTKQFDVVPPVIGGHDVLKRISSMALAFHHTDCARYKLVCLSYSSSAENADTEFTKIQIYSSDTREWRISNVAFHDPRSFSTYVVYWNGALHWAAPFDHAFYFKLDVEQIQNLPLPDKEYASFFPLYIGESRGHLNLVENANHEGSLHLNVYEMLSDHSGWFLKYKIDLHELLEAYPMIIYYLSYPPNQSNTRYNCKVLDVVRGEKEEDTFMVIKIPNKIIRYNILGKSFKPISDLTGSFLYRDEVNRYIEMIGSF